MIYNFCLQCATPLTKQDDTHYICSNGHDIWNNPRATVAVILERNGQFLFSKRGREPNKGMYDLPGGFLEYGEDPFQAAVREIKEEATLVVDPEGIEIITAYEGPYFENDSLCDIVVIARTWSGEPQAQDDSEALEWHPVNFIDDPSFAPPYDGLIDILKERL